MASGLLLVGLLLAAALILSAKAFPSPAHAGCIPALLTPPQLSPKSGVEHPGRLPGQNGGGQAVSVFLKYADVEGCETFGRVPQVRLETKVGGTWAAPEAEDAWTSLTPGLEGTDGPIEVGTIDEDANTIPLPCSDGHRPKVRAQVRTRVKILATTRNAGQSRVKDFPIPYRPPSAARCG